MRRFPYLLKLRPTPNAYACALAAGYITLTARSCLPIAEELAQALHNLAVTRRSYGKSITKEEAAEAGARHFSIVSHVVVP